MTNIGKVEMDTPNKGADLVGREGEFLKTLRRHF